MVDIALPPHLQQWTFEKSMERQDRADSATTTPDPYDSPDGLRLSPRPASDLQKLNTAEPMLQKCYLSSEEDLSPTDQELDEDELDEDDIHPLEEAEIVTAQPVPAKALGMAVMVSLVSAGRPKVVEVPGASPVKQKTRRVTSMMPLSSGQKPLFPMGNGNRLSLNTSEISLSSTNNSRYPSAGMIGSSLKYSSSTNLVDEPRTSISSSADGASRRSFSTSSTIESSRRPATAKSASAVYAPNSRASMMYPNTPLSPFPPMTPGTPIGSPSFLSTDPFATDSHNAASPIIKPAPHKRLRSISRTLSLAKIAVTGKKENRKSMMDAPNSATLKTPVTPVTPISAPPMSNPPRGRMVARPASQRMPPIEIPAHPASFPEEVQTPMRFHQSNRPVSSIRTNMTNSLISPIDPPTMRHSMSMARRMVARGADEREPLLELPPFPGDAAVSSNAGNGEARAPENRRLKKRKSLLGFV